MGIPAMVQHHYNRELAIDEAARDAGVHSTAFMEFFAHSYRESLKLVAGGIASDEQVEAAIGWSIQDYMERGNTKIERLTPEWRKLSRELASAQLEALERQDERNQGDWTGQPKQAILRSAMDNAPERHPRFLKPESALPLSEIVKKLVLEKECSSGTASEYAVAARMLEEHLGGPRPVYLITADDMVNFKDALLQTPSNYSKRFRDMPLPQAIAANQALAKPFPTLNTVTIADKWLPRVASILKYCLGNRYIPDNPCEGVRIEMKKGARKTTRTPFTISEQAKIFADPRLLRADWNEEKYWALLIALHTGCRASEIAQLKLDSIRLEQGVLVFAIEEQVKTESSKRFVPVHADLIRLGLPERIKNLRASGATHLFPTWFEKGQTLLATARKSGGVEKQPYSQTIPRWFNRSYLPSLDIIGKDKVFHCFRHTLKSALANKGISRDISDQITGHEDGSSGRRYIHGVNLALVQTALNQVRFEAIAGLSLK
jgi:integrase